MVDYVESPLEQIKAIFFRSGQQPPPPDGTPGGGPDCICHNGVFVGPGISGMAHCYVNIGPGVGCTGGFCGVWLDPATCCPPYPRAADPVTGEFDYNAPPTDYIPGNCATKVTVTWALTGSQLSHPPMGAWVWHGYPPYPFIQTTTPPGASPPPPPPPPPPGSTPPGLVWPAGNQPGSSPPQFQTSGDILAVSVDQSMFHPPPPPPGSGIVSIGTGGDAIVFTYVGEITAPAGDPAPDWIKQGGGSIAGAGAEGSYIIVSFEDCPAQSGTSRRRAFAGFRSYNPHKPLCGEFG